MKYLYEIFRLFFAPKCQHHWHTINSSELHITQDGKVIGKAHTREQECIACGLNKIESTKLMG